MWNMHSESGTRPPIMKPIMKLSLSGLPCPLHGGRSTRGMKRFPVVGEIDKRFLQSEG